MIRIGRHQLWGTEGGGVTAALVGGRSSVGLLLFSRNGNRATSSFAFSSLLRYSTTSTSEKEKTDPSYRWTTQELSESVAKKRTSYCNVPVSVEKKLGTYLHKHPNHPLAIIKNLIVVGLQKRTTRLKEPSYKMFDSLSPIVTTKQNFDDLLFAEDHITRRSQDTYYINETTLLRTHTSAHQNDLIRSGNNEFLVCGDVYRRDEIDSSHYPVFHQMEGVKLFSIDELVQRNIIPSDAMKDAVRDTIPKQHFDILPNNEYQPWHSVEIAKFIENDLKETLVEVVQHLFYMQKDLQYRWVDAYFPFTHPSWELEIFYEGKWMEVLGSGVIQQPIIEKSRGKTHVGWAFGLGLERLAMVLFKIPDIRLFWSEDPRFLSQFSEGKITTFESFSKYPPCIKDITFWVPDSYSENSFFELVRNYAHDLVESVQLIDKFVHPKTNRCSYCYRITYRSMSKSFTNEEINAIQNEIRNNVEKELGVKLR